MTHATSSFIPTTRPRQERGSKLVSLTLTETTISTRRGVAHRRQRRREPSRIFCLTWTGQHTLSTHMIIAHFITSSYTIISSPPYHNSPCYYPSAPPRPLVTVILTRPTTCTTPRSQSQRYNKPSTRCVGGWAGDPASSLRTLHPTNAPSQHIPSTHSNNQHTLSTTSTSPPSPHRFSTQPLATLPALLP